MTTLPPQWLFCNAQQCTCLYRRPDECSAILTCSLVVLAFKAESARVRVVTKCAKKVWFCLVGKASNCEWWKQRFLSNIFFVVPIFLSSDDQLKLYIFPITGCGNLFVFFPEPVSQAFLLAPLVLDSWQQNLLPEEDDITVEIKTATLRTISIISVHQTMKSYRNISKRQMKRKFSSFTLLTIRSALCDCLCRNRNLKELVYLWIVFLEICVGFKEIWRSCFFTGSSVNWLWKIYAGLLILFLKCMPYFRTITVATSYTFSLSVQYGNLQMKTLPAQDV